MLTVPATATSAMVTSAFTPSTVAEGGTTTWTVQIANPNTSTTLNGVRFFVAMPITAVYIVPEAMTGTAAGEPASPTEVLTPTRPAAPQSNYGGGSIAPGAQCVITVTMSPHWFPFDQVTLPVTVVSNEGGTSAVSSATLTALAPATTSVPSPPATTSVPSPPATTSVPGPPATTSVPGPPASTTGSDTFTHTKPNIARNGTITETVKLPGTGTVRLRETWRGKLVAHVQKTVKTGEALTIKLVPSAATRRALKSHRGATVKLSVAYTPAGGQTRTAKLTARTPR